MYRVEEKGEVMLKIFSNGSWVYIFGFGIPLFVAVLGSLLGYSPRVILKASTLALALFVLLSFGLKHDFSKRDKQVVLLFMGVPLLAGIVAYLFGYSSHDIVGISCSVLIDLILIKIILWSINN